MTDCAIFSDAVAHGELRVGLLGESKVATV
jgi:hypothetical protein